MSNITYANKEDLIVDSTIAQKNKVMASDMNMIKTCVNDNQTQINTKESLSNKVTSISSSSTDTEYPSAKCVYDNLGNKLSVTYISGSTFTLNENTQVGIYVVASDTIRIEYVDTIEGDKYFILRKGEMIKVTNSLLPDTALYVSVLAGRTTYIYGVIHIDSTDADYGKCSFERIYFNVLNKVNTGLTSVTSTTLGATTGTTTQVKLLETTILDEGVYFFNALIPMNYYGQDGRNLNCRLLVNDTQKAINGGVINTNAFTLYSPLSAIVDVPSNATIKVTIQDTLGKTFACPQFELQYIRLR
jgi:hypothetical protein